MSNKVTSQLELVSSFDWLDLNGLKDIDKLVEEVYPNKESYLKLKENIIELLKYRIDKIKEYIGKSIKNKDILEFGDCLRELRKKYKISLQALSKELGCGVPFLSLLENGKKLIPLDYVEKIAKIMNLSEDEYLKLKNSCDYSNKRVQINLEDLTEEQKEASIYFARSINNASSKQLEEIKKILNTKN